MVPSKDCNIPLAFFSFLAIFASYPLKILAKKLVEKRIGLKTHDPFHSRFLLDSNRFWDTLRHFPILGAVSYADVACSETLPRISPSIAKELNALNSDKKEEKEERE